MVCLPHKAIAAKTDEDCGDDDGCGCHFHNRNNLNWDELGGAVMMMRMVAAKMSILMVILPK